MRSLGQIPLVIGALAIFTTLQLSVNASILHAFVVSIDSEASLDAISVGQAMLDEIMTKGFDKATLGTRIYDRSALTPAALFGPDTAETVIVPDREPFGSGSAFDDIDDYHGYTRIVVSPRLGDFIVRDSVYYVQENNQDIPSPTQTWYKKVIVTVSNTHLSTPVKVSSLTVYRRFF